MEKDTIYIDSNEGPESWFGVFTHKKPGIFRGNWTCKWQVINNTVIKFDQDGNNHYALRPASNENLIKIRKILKNLGYKLDKNYKLIEVESNTIRRVIKTVQSNPTLSSSDKNLIIKALSKYESDD